MTNRIIELQLQINRTLTLAALQRSPVETQADLNILANPVMAVKRGLFCWHDEAGYAYAEEGGWFLVSCSAGRATSQPPM